MLADLPKVSFVKIFCHDKIINSINLFCVITPFVYNLIDPVYVKATAQPLYTINFGKLAAANNKL